MLEEEETGFTAALFTDAAGDWVDWPQEKSRQVKTNKQAEGLPGNGTGYFLTGLALGRFKASTAARVGVPLQQAIPFFVHCAAAALELLFATTGFTCCAVAARPHPQKTDNSIE